jgi:eukaryotic-like serine/threonine-protein kinase
MIATAANTGAEEESMRPEGFGSDGHEPVSTQGGVGGGGEHPQRIGGYRIVRVLGEGGMGVVYLAEQTEPVRREVALKILKPGMDTRQVVARFEAERQSLAVMEHPGIAKVYHAGATETGRPYFVMERVDGVPITEYCAAHRLGLRERVRLFAQVCRAVQHAHQKGVIHRDLKPSNVLVTVADDRPLCKIIDFGIAKAVEKTLEEQTRLTQLDQSLGTPAYMSPEQVEGAGQDIDTRSDIYSLGVLLYELLAGVLPFEPQAYRGWAFYAQHLVREPPVPSARFRGLVVAEQARIAELRRADSAALCRQLRSDLDWIAMRALERDRERRYETANGFALDLERFLANEPVAASPPSRAYRTRKFVRRHRVGVVFAAVLTVLLVGFATAMGVQAERIARARDLAVVRQGQAEGLIDFMLTDLRAKLEPVGRLDLLADVGQQALAYFAALPEDQFTDDELLSRSQALSQIGQVRIEAGDPAGAIGALHESLRFASALSARRTDDPRRLYQLSQSHFWVGFAAWRSGDLDGAEARFQDYLRLARRLVEREPDNLDYRLELGYAHSNLGSLREARGDFEGAVREYARTLEVKEDLVRRDPKRIGWVGELAETHNTLAVAYRKMGAYEQARQEHRREYELKLAALELDPTHAYWRSRLGWAHQFMGNLELLVGQPGSARRNYLAAVVTMDSLVAHDPANAGWRRAGAIARRQLGIAQADLGQQAASLQAFQDAIGRFDELLRMDSTAFDWRLELGLTRLALARALLGFGQPEAALREAENAVAHLAAARGAGRALRVARAETDLVRGNAFANLGRPAEADTMYERSLEQLGPLGGGSEVADIEPLFAEAHLGLGRDDDARPLLENLDRRGYRGRFLTQLRRQGRPPRT